MRFGVDGRVLHGPPTGTAVYARGLVGALAAHADVESVVAATYAVDSRGPAPISELHQAGIETVELGRLRSRVPGAVARTGVPVPFDSLLRGADWYLYPNFRWLPLRHGRSITVVHDLTALDHGWSVPSRYRRRVEAFTRTAMSRSTVVATPSRSVAEDLCIRFPDSTARIVAVRPGTPPWIAGGSAARRPASERRGVIFVGTVQPRKSVRTLISAYGRLPASLRSAHSLRIIGRPGWEQAHVFRRLEAMSADVTVSGYVSPSVLHDAYASAAVLVAPSLYEGFDLPVLEAMSVGTPLICSDIPVHREVAGPAGTYFPPGDAAALTAALIDTLSDPARQKELSTGAISRSREFSWSRAATALLDALSDAS